MASVAAYLVYRFECTLHVNVPVVTLGNRSLRARRGSDIAADNVAQSKRDPAQREVCTVKCQFQINSPPCEPPFSQTTLFLYQEKLAAQQMTIKQFVEEHMGRWFITFFP